MFKRFSPDEVSTSTNVKSSVQRKIRESVLELNPPKLVSYIDTVLPRTAGAGKGNTDILSQYKVMGSHTTLYTRGPDAIPVFFQHRDGPIMPSLKLCHKFPRDIFTHVMVDGGAVPYILGGANIMCPGLTNTCGSLSPGQPELPSPKDADSEEEVDGFPAEYLPKGQPVVIYAEGKEFALAVGTMKMSADNIRTKNKGMAIEVAHFLGDGLYMSDGIN